MEIIRTLPPDDYVLISNYHLKDKGLSLDAKGLLSQILSAPSGWDLSLSGLSRFNREPEAAIQAVLYELETAGYLTQEIDRSTGMTEYIVHERSV